jgi:WD40 repeat protein
LTFIRQLTGHNVPLATIDINDLTGDIATCSGTWLHLWSINGDPLASVNTLVGRICRSQHILCVCFSQFNEWDPMNMILTGSTDGVVRMWPLDHVQVQKVDQMLCLLILNLLFECCRFLMRKHPHK